MAKEGKLSDIVWERHPNLYVAAQSTYVDSDDAQNINKYAWLARKHDELIEMPLKDRSKAFNSLQDDVQTLLKSYFETDYNFDDAPQSTFGKIIDSMKSAVSTLNPIRFAFTAADAYGRALGANYIKSTEWDKYDWSQAFDGEKIFDGEEDARLRALLPEEVYKISKLAAMGESPGQILSKLETDAEFEAFDQYVNNNDIFKDSIARFKNSKISFGRDFARNVLNLKTDDSFLFTVTSGAADLFYQVVSDPMTYATFGIGKGFQLAGVGIVRGSRAISAFMDGSRDVGELFNKPGVRKYWDNLGKTIKDLDGDAETAATARQSIQKLYNEVDDANFIDLLRKSKVYDAASAEQFFAGGEKLEYLLKGKIRADRQVMPTWGWGKELRKGMNTVIDNVFYNSEKAAPALRTLQEWEDNLIKSGDSFEDADLAIIPDAVKLAKSRRNALERFARKFENAPVVSGIRLLRKEQTDAKGKTTVVDEFVQSSDDIYKLARVVYNRREANVVRYSFEQADTAKRFMMLRGLYVQIGQEMGLTDTAEGRNFLSQVMRAQFDNAYTERVKLSDVEIDDIAKSNPDLANVIRANDNTWTPARTGDGVSNAAVWWQVAGQIAVPRFDIWARQARTGKAAGARFLGGAVDSRYHDVISQGWTLLTLFPRNGMRGAIDEMLTFGLTAPLTSILKWQGARALSRTVRTVQDPSGKTLLLYQQFLRNTVLKGLKVDDADYAAIVADNTGDTLKRVVNKKFLEETARTLNFGGLSADDMRFIESAINNGVFFDNLPYVQGGTTKGYKNANPKATLRDDNIVGQNAVISFNQEKVLEDLREMEKLVQRKSQFGGGLYTTKPNLLNAIGLKRNEYVFSWSEQIFMRVSHDPAAARIFLQHHKNPSKAIEEIAKYYRGNKTILNNLKIRAVDPNVDPIVDAATNHFMHLRSVLFDKDGNLLSTIQSNMSNILKKDANGNTKLDLEWLGTNLREIVNGVDVAKAPDELVGNLYEYRGLSKNAGEMVQKLEDGAWGIMDNQASMMFREPAYFANYLFTRKKLKGAEKQMVKRLENSGHTVEEALKLADAHFANLSGKLAMERTIAYIDNPLVRSNLAFHIRNFARFYRATEDFYRRYGRAIKNDPQSIIRLRLATQGLSGSGFIHQTEDGDDYFIMPGDSWMWTSTAALYKTLTGKEMLAVNPIEFGVKIQMISPSLDPDSALPSFAGPLAAIPVKAITGLLNTEFLGDAVPGEFKRGFDKFALGVYSENSNLIEAMMPGSVRKVLNALTPNERNAQFVSAANQAILYTASNPNIKTPGPDATFMEKQEFIAQVKATAANIIFLRNMIGLVAPAGLSSMQTKDVPDYIKEVGFTSMSREFYRLVESLNENLTEDAWSEALLKWTYDEKNLGRLVYTVAATERTGPSETVKIQSTKEAADWVASNPKLVRKYPTAALLFAPQIGEFDIGAYSYLKNNGYIKNKDIDTFLTDVNLVQAKRSYFQLGRIYEDRILRTVDPGTKSLYRSQLENIRREMRALNPELDRELADYSFSNIKEQEAIEELRSLLASGLVDDNPRSQRLALMLKRFDENRIAYTYSVSNGLSAESRRNINIGGLGELEGIAGKDKSLQLALDSLFAPILER